MTADDMALRAQVICHHVVTLGHLTEIHVTSVYIDIDICIR